MPHVVTLPILANNEVAKDHFELVFPNAPQFEGARPGQFVNVLCRSDETYDPLLRRPFSFYRMGNDQFSVLYRLVGRGTRLLSRMKPGDTIGVVGPLGNGFDLSTIERSAPVVVIGGGVGTPPIFHLSQTLRDRGIDHQVIVGFATEKQIIAVDEWRKVGIEPIITTDDGSVGLRGVVTDPLREIIAKGGVKAVFACGPQPMLRAVAALCKDHGVACQVSMEEWMGCGVGACLSCVRRIKVDGVPRWVRLCVEGPVLDGAKVVWS